MKTNIISNTYKDDNKSIADIILHILKRSALPCLLITVMWQLVAFYVESEAINTIIDIVFIAVTTYAITYTLKGNSVFKPDFIKSLLIQRAPKILLALTIFFILFFSIASIFSLPFVALEASKHFNNIYSTSFGITFAIAFLIITLYSYLLCSFTLIEILENNINFDIAIRVAVSSIRSKPFYLLIALIIMSVLSISVEKISYYIMASCISITQLPLTETLKSIIYMPGDFIRTVISDELITTIPEIQLEGAQLAKHEIVSSISESIAYVIDIVLFYSLYIFTRDEIVKS